MKSPSRTFFAAGITAVLMLGGLGAATPAAVRAQPPGTPAAGHGSMSMEHHGAEDGIPACVATPTQVGIRTGSTPQSSSHEMIATPGQDRQAQVAANGALVMPFDLNRTSHTFIDLPDGGREIVTANDPSDVEQIALIRAHLEMEAHKFSVGDFSDPAQIHGNDMPGLDQLESGFAGIELLYEELPNGAAITYRSAVPALVSALHTWFAAQRSDHGNC